MVGTMNSLVNVETRNDFTNYLCHYLLPSFVLFPIRIEKKKEEKGKKNISLILLKFLFQARVNPVVFFFWIVHKFPTSTPMNCVLYFTSLCFMFFDVRNLWQLTNNNWNCIICYTLNVIVTP